MITIKHQIKTFGGSVLFEAELPSDTPSGMVVRAALEQATEKRADLRGAHLSGAYLRGAHLSGAHLRGAHLSGALRGDQKLIGDRPVLQIGPIGSRADYLVAYITDGGVMLRAGCFFGTVEEFEQACAETHGDNGHGHEYKAALAMVQVHAEIWTPKVEQTEAVEVTP